MKRWISWLCLVALVSGNWSARGAGEPAAIGRKVTSFTLADAEGNSHSLPDSKEAKFVVVAFLGCECPLVTNIYAERLERIATEFADRGVRVLAIDSNSQDSAGDVQAFVRKQQIGYPVLLDPNADVADNFHATRTPEVFLLDETRVVRYHGRIDDQGRVGVIRSQPDRRDLVEAIEELISGRPVSQPELPAVGCLIGRRRQAKPNAEVTYSSHIAAIFQKRCVQCHRDGDIGPFSMESYDEVAGWAPMILEVVEEQRMPPWFASPAHGKFRNDARLTEEEKSAIRAWVHAGAPLGNAAELPSLAARSDGWDIGKPDLVVPMAEKPFAIPATGTIPYQHYVIDPKLSEDKWIVACECKPGNRSVVHHVLVFRMEPGRRNIIGVFYDGGLIAAYGPGAPGFRAPAGAGIRIPKGSKFLVQMHYTANGRPNQEDMTQIAFKFGDEREMTHEMQCKAAHNDFVLIPPGVADHRIKAKYVFQEDRILYNMAPHMHMRGKSFSFVARYPDDRRETLLDVPRFDFNWQIQYDLAEPKLMPKGTVLECVAHYDNSTNNPANPDPTAVVTFGEQTWNEMMIGWFTSMVPRAKEPTLSSR
ncbi:MAG: redoxin domain-containing protein [Planctomycetota bacterium]